MRVALGVKLKFGEGSFHQGHLVGVVVYCEVAGDADILAVASQDAGAKGVKCGDGSPLGGLAQEGDKPLAHFAGRLVGEGDGGDAVGRDPDHAHEVGDAVGDDAGFAAAGAGYDEQGAVDGGDGGALVVV